MQLLSEIYIKEGDTFLQKREKESFSGLESMPAFPRNYKYSGV